MVLKKMENQEERGLGYTEYDRKPRRIDVTQTMAYKELYANNLRMYGFLMKKELDRRSQQKLQNKKEDYFQRHVTSQTHQRNNRLLKSFKQMSRMRTCLSELDLSRISEPDCPSLNQQDRKQSLFDVRHPEERLELRPRARTMLDGSSASTYSQFHGNKDLGKSRQISDNFLKVPLSSGMPVSPLASPTSLADRSVTLPPSSPSPSRQRYLTLNRRHYSDLGARIAVESDFNSDSDVTNSDSEAQSGDNNDENGNELKVRSPSMNRARQARIRHEFRKARLASLEGTISKANTMLKDIRRSSLPKKITHDLAMDHLQLEQLQLDHLQLDEQQQYGSLPNDI